MLKGIISHTISFGEWVGRGLKLRLYLIARKLRLTRRISSLNRWGEKNPRLFCGIAFGIFAAIGVSAFFGERTSLQMPSFDDIAPVNKLVGAARTSREAVTDVQSNLLLLLYNREKAVEELDSLKSLPNWTEEDSLKANSVIERIQIIDNALNYETN